MGARWGWCELAGTEVACGVSASSDGVHVVRPWCGAERGGCVAAVYVAFAVRLRDCA